MENPYYAFTIPMFTEALSALKGVLKKGEEFAKEKGKTDADILGLKLAADMLPLSKQVQIACDNAKGAAARLTGATAPKMEDNEAAFAELYTRIDKTLEYISSVKPEDFANAKDIKIKMPYFPADMHFTGDGYTRLYVIRNFFFHVVTAYDILRNAGVVIGKTDYMGNLPLVKD